MKIEGVPYKTVNWNEIPAEEHKGETGAALWRTFSQGNVRARVVEYGPGYLADQRASSSTARATSPTTGARAGTCCS